MERSTADRCFFLPPGLQNLKELFNHDRRVFADPVIAATKIDLEVVEAGELRLDAMHCQIATLWLAELVRIFF